MRDWTNIERQYQQLKADCDLAWKRYTECPTDALCETLSDAQCKYSAFCTVVLEELMEQHRDVLQRLKTGG